ncbi:MAG: type I polyketide synthase, partial [Gammaproteobacteria bacterium]|nr:type I polyketide synthase [Gammaproteobacteria bacterium]
MTKKNNTELEPIAIIGMSCVFPQAADIESFWNNILGCVDAITEPADVWDADRYLDSGRINTPFGGFLKELYRFDPREFGIMPNSVDGGEPDQYLALRVTRDALKDSGYLREDYDHTDTGIVLGHSTYLHRGQGVLVQQHIVLDQTIDLLQEVMPSLDDEKLASIKALLRSKLPPTNADTSPGLVPNVMTGRIANRLNLRGPNYLVDAACSSSLLAVNSAMDELRNGRSRIMIAGGVNASLPAEVSVIFTQLGALSARGKVRPFENGSDGTLLGEGLGVVVLKRLSDAIEDKDKVYAVIRGIGQASDGKGHGLLAPSVEGETLAIQRAYDSAAIEPSTIGMIEAHGTGIPLGDKTEVSALRNVFGERNGDHTAIALGSVKSMISHCIPAAGIAGLIKSALALHHKVLPPTLCADVNQTLGINSTPLYVNTESLPWIKKAGFPRRAGINSFGFGGINTHAILEEAPPASVKPETCLHWPAELCVFSASSREKLLSKIRQLIEFLKVDNDYRLVDIANALHRDDSNESCRLAIVHNDKEGLTKKLNQAINQIQNNDKPQWSTRNGVIFSEVTNDGKLAFIFPGEGSQYIGMFKDLAICFDEVREWFDYWSSLYGEEPDGSTRTDIVFSPASEMSDEKMARLELRLHSMDIGSEAVFIGGQAMFSLLVSLGVEADVMLGHSSGESSALAASGAMKYKSREQLAGYIRRLNEIYKDVLGSGGIPTGALLTVGALPQHTVEHFIQEVDKNIHIAMDNCINQLVLFGDKLSIDKLQEVLSDAGGICILLPFDRGYHTPLFSAVSKAFLDYYDEIGLGKPGVPLYSCASTEIFPESKKDIKKLAASQWSNRVRFRETIENMHKDGVRYFIEVGPSGNLSSFVNDVLVGKDYVSMATNIRRKNSVEQVLVVLGNLYVNGKNPDIAKLFKSRAVRDIDLSIIESRNSYGILLDNTMPVIQLDSSDRKQLRSIIAHDIVASNTGQAVNIGEGSNPVVSGADDVVAASGRDSVMTDYFSLMSDFLEKQHSLMGLIADGNDEQSSENKDFPFITNIIDSNDNYIRAAVYLNDYDDNFLKDHVISGVVSDDPDLKGLSCVPMMVSLEIMAEACCLLAGRNDLAVIKNVAAFDWIALDDNELELEVYVELLSNEDATYKAILSNNSSTIISTEFSFAKDWVCQAIPQLKAGREFRWKESEMYTEGMFHGPVFQSLHRITGWDDEGIDAELSKVSLSDFFVKTE